MEATNQLEQLIQTLEHQKNVRKDYMAASGHLHFTEGKLVMIKNGHDIIYTPSKIFHTQVCEKLKIPKNYYERMMQDALPLLDSNVNHWLNKEQKTMLIRTFEEEAANNTARALLSNSYNIIENFDVLFEALEAIKRTGIKVQIINAELSESRMYLKVACPEVEVKAHELLKKYRLSTERGSGIISGFVLQNSEVGNGAFKIIPRAVVLACNNGMTHVKDALKRIHLGAATDELEFNKNEAVRKANIRLIKEQVKHAVELFLSEDYLKKIVNFYTEIGDKEISAPITNVVEVIAKDNGLSDARKENILDYFLKGGDNRRIGLFNAITEECQTLTDPDARHDSELIAADMLTNFSKIEASAVKLQAKAN